MPTSLLIARIARFFLFFTAGLVSCSIVLFCPAEVTLASDLEEIKKLDAEVLQHKKKITRVEKGILSHESKVVTSKAREMCLLAELEKIDEKILAESEQLDLLKEEMNRQDQLTKEKKDEMEKTLFEKETLGEHTEKRLAAYYKMGEIGIINVIFSSSTLPELLSFQENFHLMLKYDNQVINAFKNKITDLTAARRAHEEEKIRLSAMIDNVREQQKILAEFKLERRQLLARVKTEKLLYQQAIEELEEAAKRLTATLTELEKEAAQTKEEWQMQRIKDYPLKAFKKRRPASLRGFANQKGTLPLPATGAVLQKFGSHTDNTFGMTTVTNGIGIESDPGMDIIAVYDGKVVYAGALRGYGQLIIIDHGNHYFSLVSGIGEILTKVGDPVDQHEKIGITSLHTGLLQEGLHFEIRHNTQAQNPLDWLDPSQLSYKKSPKPTAQ